MAIALAFALVFVAGAALGHGLSVSSSPFATFWPMSGVYVAVLLRAERRLWPALVAGAVVANVGVESLWVGQPVWVAVGFAAANTAEALTAATLLRAGEGRLDLAHRPSLLRFVLVSCLAAGVIGAGIGTATVLAAIGGDAWTTFGGWWVADAVGILLCAPVLLVPSADWQQLRLELTGRLLLEAVAALGLLIVVVIGIFCVAPAVGEWTYLGLPALLWITLRFRLPGTTIGLLIIAVIAVIATNSGNGPYATRPSPAAAVAELQGFLAVTSFCFLCLAALVTDADRAARRLDAINRSLSGEVARQTATLSGTLARLQLALHGAGMGTWQWTVGTREMVLDPRQLALLGVPADAPLGSSTILARVPPADSARLRADLDRWMRDGGLWEYEHRVLDDRGRVRWVAGRAAFIVDVEGRRIATGVSWDVTRQREAETALRERDERFRQLADHLDAGLWLYDVSSERVHYLSSGFTRVWGVPAGELIDAAPRWQTFVHADDRPRIAEAFQAFLAGRADYVVEYRIVIPGGRMRWVQDRAFVVSRDDQGAIAMVAGLVIDTTDRRATEQALREAERQKDAFLAMLAHELRNPLAPIRTATQILGVATLDETSRMQARAIIERQVAHIVRLVDDLLDASRLSGGRLVLERRDVDLAAIVRDTVDDYARFLTGAQLTLDVRVPDGPIWVLGDRTRLAQVLGNLLHNARKFTPAGGRVTVTLMAEETAVATLSVRDTGSGIAGGLLPRVFEPFTQEHQTIDRSTGGLGLGLSLVKGLVELHGGTVTAASGGPGCGTEVVVSLPTLAMARPAPPRPPAAAAEPAVSLRVLVIEDYLDAATMLRLLLELDGHVVELAHTGHEGLAAVERFSPDLVLCDIGLPGELNGLDVARALAHRESRPFLVAVSGYAGEEHVRAVRAAGFDRHMTKPVGPEELPLLIADVRQRHTARRSNDAPRAARAVMMPPDPSEPGSTAS